MAGPNPGWVRGPRHFGVDRATDFPHNERGPMRAPTALLLFLGISLGMRAAARADITPPFQAACHDAKPGDPCTSDDGPGVCTKTTCSRVRPGPDGHPVTRTYDCMKCLPPPAKPDPAKPSPARPAAASVGAEPDTLDAEPARPR